MLKQIEIANKLYEARRGAQLLYRDKYPAKIEQYQGFIRAGMQEFQCSEGGMPP